MDTKEITRLALRLMDQHGLLDRGWTFRFDRAKKRLGCCWVTRKTISLSLNYVDNLSEAEIRDVCLHEIAHALADIRHGREGFGHGYLWKRICVEIGADPTRLYEGETVSAAKPKYYLAHAETNEIFGKYYRKPVKLINSIERRWIRGRKTETHGKLKVFRVNHQGETVEIWTKKVLTIQPNLYYMLGQ